MATASITYTFVPATLVEAAKVNQNFTDLLGFLNASVVHADASIPFTAVPSGPAVNPTTDNQLSRKRYVDDVAKIRPQVTRVQGPLTAGYTAGNQVYMMAGSATVSLDGSKAATISMGAAFPSGFITVLATAGASDGTNQTHAVHVTSYSSPTASSFTIMIKDAIATNQRINWIAFGW